MREHDLRARLLLRLIAEREAEGAPIQVKELLKLDRIGTAPTIFDRIDGLERSGWIRRVPDSRDGRAKRLHLTPHARNMFRTLSRQVEDLLRR